MLARAQRIGRPRMTRTDSMSADTAALWTT